MKLSLLTLVLVLSFARALAACPYTPLAWQGIVETHANAALVGQRKHTTWIRDQDRNFVDDIIDASAGKWGSVDVTVDLNRCLTPEQIGEIFSRFGHIAYVGKLITAIQLDKVLESDLPKLAALPQVAMVEYRELVHPSLDTAAAAIEAHRSSTYAGLSAEDNGLDGSGITIAFIGTGITDSAFTQLAGKLVAGFDATDPADPKDGSTNPTDTTTHESVMAALAVGAKIPGQTCRTPSGAAGGNCGGVAPGARYVNVRQCHVVNGSTQCDAYENATDWVGLNAKRFGIRVVNMAFSSCGDDDGTSAKAQQANYLAGMGMVVVASSSKNPANCSPAGAIGDRVVRAPGSGSFVLMVNATNDASTVSRTDDTVWNNFTVGPRKDFTAMAPLDFGTLKPDIAAPGTNLEVYRSPSSPHLTGVAGTSPAAALVSGAAALLLQRYPNMTPDSVKALLIASADSTRNTPHNSLTGVWDHALGWGIVNVGEALRVAAAQQGDVAFPNCAPGSVSGQPCSLTNQNPPWNNDSDITTITAPRVNHPTTIVAQVTNRGQQAATVTVNFGVMVFSAGNNQFHSIGSQQVVVQPNQTLPVRQDWTPLSTDHTCAQVSIAYGSDSDYSNNMTQRNLQIAPSVFRMQVNNPLFEPARFEVIAKPERPDWSCEVDLPKFELDPFKECPRDVTITFNAPKGSKVGDRAKCDVGVYATPLSGGERQLVGGVTVVTYVPAPCKIIGQIVDAEGQPFPEAKIAFVPSKSEEHPDVKAQSAVSDGTGVFTITTVPDVEQIFSVRSAKGLYGELIMRPMCGPSLPRVVLSERGLKLDYLPPVLVQAAADRPATTASLAVADTLASSTAASPNTPEPPETGCSTLKRNTSSVWGSLFVGTLMAGIGLRRKYRMHTHRSNEDRRDV